MENDAVELAAGFEGSESEPSYSLSPDQATGFGAAAEAPAVFNRKRVMVVLASLFATFIGGGLLINAARPGKMPVQRQEAVTAAMVPDAFIASLRNKAVSRNDPPYDGWPQLEAAQPDQIEPQPASLPAAEPARLPEVELLRSHAPPPQRPAQGAPPAPQPPSARGQVPPSRGQELSQAHSSSLVPSVQGSMISAGGSSAPGWPAQAPSAQAPGGSAADYFAAQSAARASYGGQASEYASQNNQANKLDFFNPAGGGGAASSGRFLGESSLWPGTSIPGILDTAINTDLPGNVIARVTRNIYDSQTGQTLLIPQGSILVAKYNSSVSYAQRRVQIVWDTLIRPDGFQLDLDGMNSVDRSGMSGQGAEYHENWFEYLKAAGIITLFSLANASLTETAAKFANDTAASAVAGANTALVNQLGGAVAARAMNIQPTLTVKSGTLINVMLNKTLYLPPADGRRTGQKYILE